MGAKFLFIFALALFVQNSLCFKLDRDLLDQLINQYEERNAYGGAHSDEIEFIKYSETLLLPDFGQVGGLATEENGDLVVFHRASRKWDYDSFDRSNRFNKEKYGAIEEPVVARINIEGSDVVSNWGQNEFYMPHGLTIDSKGNYWLTDVGLHQVFKYEKDRFDKPALKLGVAFETGDDETHFCKPTDVAVSALNGDVFVSDGYCNSRVVQFDKNGKYQREFKLSGKDSMVIPHSIALIDELNLVCTADRENGRIVCFHLDSDKDPIMIKHPKMKRVFAIEYNKATELLHAVSGAYEQETPRGSGIFKKKRPLGFTFNAAKGVVFGDFLVNFEPPNDKHFEDPHDITTTQNGHIIYTGELNGNIDEFILE